MQTANRPGTFPIPRSITTGINYTKLGIVCITSNIGVINVCALFERAIKIPIGIPMLMQTIVATEMIARVAMVSSHISKYPMTKKASTAPIVSFKLLEPK